LTLPGDELHIDYACADGTPFPVAFSERRDLDVRWALDREHAPTARTPLADSVARAGAAGAAWAYAECGLALPSTLRRKAPRANGFEYHVDHELPEAEQRAFTEGLAALVKQYGGTRGVWLNLCLPHVRDACTWLQAPPEDATFRALAERHAYTWGHTAVAGVVARGDLRAVASSCEPAFGDRASLIAHELAQGSENETIAADVALVRIARMDPDSVEAASARNEFLHEYGARSVSWSIDHPTVLERPDLLDAQLRLLRRHSSRTLADGAVTNARARRRTLVEQVRARLGNDAERARFDRRLARLEAFVPVREARARWQLVASGALRRAVQARGRVLVERGVIDEIDDVFFLTPSEFDEPARGLRTDVPARRADHERWMAVSPPVVIGDTGPGPSAVADDLVQGASGAPGVAAGPARVILDLLDAERLEPGDVLVTTMTSPPWTPLFGIATAVVTDSGDAVSHVAIAAREYGIPCVVGTNDATRRVRDGSAITVDGDAGIVRIHT
jgi:phosphohistidine swiveling domain-containing protein